MQTANGVWVADLREYKSWPKSAQEIVYGMLQSMGADRCHTVAITPTKVYAFCYATDEHGKMYLSEDGNEIATKLVVRERRQK